MKNTVYVLCIAVTSAILSACGGDTKQAVEVYTQGKKAYIKKDLKKAEELLLKSLGHDARLSNARLMLAKIYYYNKAYAQALEELDTLLKKDELHVGAMYWKARTLLVMPDAKSGSEDTALELLQKIVECDEDHLPARLLRALLYEKRKNIKEAVYEYKRIQALEDILVQNRANLALLYKKIGLDKKALKEVSDAIAIANIINVPVKNLEKIKQTLDESKK